MVFRRTGEPTIRPRQASQSTPQSMRLFQTVQFPGSCSTRGSCIRCKRPGDILGRHTSRIHPVQ